MFDVMRSRWFYISDKFLIGKHPRTQEIVLLLRKGESETPSEEIKRILILNGMKIKGPLTSEEGQQYYELSEVNENDTAT